MAAMVRNTVNLGRNLDGRATHVHFVRVWSKWTLCGQPIDRDTWVLPPDDEIKAMARCKKCEQVRANYDNPISSNPVEIQLLTFRKQWEEVGH